MSRQAAVRVMAGSMVLLSLVLGLWVSRYWFWLTAFVGTNLLQSGFTGFCLAQTIFARLGLKDGSCPASGDDA